MIPCENYLVENTLGEFLNLLLEVNQESVLQPICDNHDGIDRENFRVHSHCAEIEI